MTGYRKYIKRVSTSFYRFRSPASLSIVGCLLLSAVLFASVNTAFSAERVDGKSIYEARCAWCHGSDGTGYGVAAKYLNPPPRDFSFAEFKWKRTESGNDLPTKKDLYSFISGLSGKSSHWSGITGTAMPGWSDLLSGTEIEAVAEYVKSLAYITQALPGATLDLSGRVEATKESIINGRKLFRNRCSECHGMYGRGNGSKRLKDGTGERTWPRNLTKPWLFRSGTGNEDIFTRITLGIAGTQMPAFGDKKSRKSLTESQRWDVANYVVTLTEPYKEPAPGAIIRAVRLEGALPESPLSPEWAAAEYASFYLVPQMITKERFYTPSIDSLSVKALYNREAVAILIEWDDPTESLPGEAKSESIAGGRVYIDAAAVQFPRDINIDSSTGAGFYVADTPYLGMGDVKKPVDIWYWGGPGKGTADGVKFIESFGAGKFEVKEGNAAGLGAIGVYDEGTWHLIITRSLDQWGGSGESAVSGATVPVAFALWDGSNGERGSKHTLTPWVPLAFETETDIMVYILPAFIFILVLGIEVVWLCNIDR